MTPLGGEPENLGGEGAAGYVGEHVRGVGCCDGSERSYRVGVGGGVQECEAGVGHCYGVADCQGEPYCSSGHCRGRRSARTSRSAFPRRRKATGPGSPPVGSSLGCPLVRPHIVRLNSDRGGPATLKTGTTLPGPFSMMRSADRLDAEHVVGGQHVHLSLGVHAEGKQLDQGPHLWGPVL